jgi:hypothetical protein
VRSEASDSTSGCKSRRRKSPCGAVVISGSRSGRPDGWKPGSKSPRRPSKAQVGSVQGASNQEGRSQSERSNRRNSSPHEADSRMLGDAKVFHHLPDGQCRDRRMGKHVSGLPAEVEGGNPGKLNRESSEGLATRQDDPANANDPFYNQLCWEVNGRPPDRRMRPRSVDGWSMITQSERGPLGPGGYSR